MNTKVAAKNERPGFPVVLADADAAPVAAAAAAPAATAVPVTAADAVPVAAADAVPVPVAAPVAAAVPVPAAAAAPAAVANGGPQRVSDARPEHRFFAADLCVDIARALVAPLSEIKRHDAENWDQAYRALKGMALCVAEGGRRRKMDRANFFDMAAGSAQELRMALTLAVTFGAIGADVIAPIDRMIDRLLGMLWKLARRAEADATAARKKR